MIICGFTVLLTYSSSAQAQIKSSPLPQVVRAQPSLFPARAPMLRPLNNGTVRASLVQVKFQSTQLYVVARFNATNLRGESIRMGLFFYWADGSPLEINPSTTPSDYSTWDGYLTQQYVDVAPYASTDWSNIEFTIPYSYFPPVTNVSNVFMMAAVGIDGQDFVGRSYRQYFVLNP